MRVSEAFDELGTRASQWLASTSAIYQHTPDGTPESIGTGIFFTHRGHSLVLSAAHVLNELHDRPLFIGSDHLNTMVGDFVTAEDDDVDLGFFPLSETQRDALPGARFLTRDDVELMADSTSEGPDYYLVGFRAEDNPPASRDQLLSVGSAYRVKAAPTSAYESFPCSQSTYLLVSFNLGTMFSSPTLSGEAEAPPCGMSGCGIWRLTSTVESDRLVAILIEYHRRLKVIVGTRLDGLFTEIDAYTERA